MNIAVLAKNEKVDFFICEWSNFHYSLEKKIVKIPKDTKIKFEKSAGSFEIELIAN